ncbi:hypothetical protein A2U01_0042640, partial [Trifolium medium]|nr:hypothetical protein [Trifolium medium]
EGSGHKTTTTDALEDEDLYHSEELTSPISTDDEDDGSEKLVFPQYNESARFGEVLLKRGMEFPNLAVFKEAVRDYSIHIRRDYYYWVKNESYRAIAKCKVKGCTWEILCSKNARLKSYQIKTYTEEHSCIATNTIKQARRTWVVKILQEKLRIQPTITRAQIFDNFKTKFGVEIDRSKINRAVKKARELVEGCEKDQYGLIWD